MKHLNNLTYFISIFMASKLDENTLTFKRKFNNSNNTIKSNPPAVLGSNPKLLHNILDCPQVAPTCYNK